MSYRNLLPLLPPADPARRLRWGTVVALAALLSTSAAFATDDVFLDTSAPWPKKHRDHRNTGQSPYPGPTLPVLTGETTAVGLGGMVLYDPTGELRTSPTVGPDGTVYIGHGLKPIHAFNPDGSFKWDTTGVVGGDSLHSSPSVGVGVPSGKTIVYMGERNNKVIAVSDGGQGVHTIEWLKKLQQDGDITSSVTFALDGSYIFGGCGCVGGGFLAAYKACPDPGAPRMQGLEAWPAGEIDWTAHNRGMSGVSPAVNDIPGDPNEGHVYVVDTIGRVQAYSPTGVFQWQSEPSGGRVQDVSPMIGPDGRVYVGGDKGVRAIEPPPSGASATDMPADWEFTAVAGVRTTIAYADCTVADNPAICGLDGTLYFGDEAGWFYAVDAATGELRWAIYLKDPVSGPAAIDRYGIVYVTTDETGTVFALRPDHADLEREQRILWQKELNGRVRQNMVALGVLPQYDLMGEPIRDIVTDRLVGDPVLYAPIGSTLYAIHGTDVDPGPPPPPDALPAPPTGWSQIEVSSLKGPRRVRIGDRRPRITRKLVLRLRNGGVANAEVTRRAILDLLEVEVEPLAPLSCEAPLITILDRRLKLPSGLDSVRILPPGKKMAVRFQVSFACAPDPDKTTKSENHDDFQYRIILHQDGIVPPVEVVASRQTDVIDER